MATLSKSTLFPAELATEMFNKVVGHSSLAKMSGAEPIPFNGKDIFTFDFSHEIAIVGENAAKPAGDATISPVQIRPIKVVYQSRVSDEFIYASEEAQLQYLTEFAKGFEAKLGRGLDIMAMHGLNPYDGNAASGTIANNYLDYVIANYNSGSNKITLGHDSTEIDANIEEMISAIEDAELQMSGMILSTAARKSMSVLDCGTNNKSKRYPEFEFGGFPASLGGATLDVNGTVSANSSLARAYAGDFNNAFRWGYAKEMPLEVIEYGNPDGGTYDLKQANQVLLRSEAYIGWGFMNPASFAMIAAAQANG